MTLRELKQWIERLKTGKSPKRRFNEAVLSRLRVEDALRHVLQAGAIIDAKLAQNPPRCSCVPKQPQTIEEVRNLYLGCEIPQRAIMEVRFKNPHREENKSPHDWKVSRIFWYKDVNEEGSVFRSVRCDLTQDQTNEVLANVPYQKLKQLIAKTPIGKESKKQYYRNKRHSNRLQKKVNQRGALKTSEPFPQQQTTPSSVNWRELRAEAYVESLDKPPPDVRDIFEWLAGDVGQAFLKRREGKRWDLDPKSRDPKAWAMAQATAETLSTPPSTSPSSVGV